jgi:DNA-binding transcriptional ArsR family regulator
MIEFVLSDPDLLAVRFAISPLNELTLSLRALKNPKRYPTHRHWVAKALQPASGLDLDLLFALTNDRGWTPDFLSPRPVLPLTRIENELERLADVSPDVIEHDLAQIHGRLTRQPRWPSDRIALALHEYWQLCFATSWDRMRAVLDGDVLYRGRVMTHEGLGAMVSGISSRVTFDSPIIRVQINGVPSRRVQTGGAGVTLLPSLFALHTGVPVDPGAPPMLIYAARGAGTVWEAPRLTASDGLAGLLGSTRAALLGILDVPVSSADLAQQLGVTTSAANQHLRALAAGGLLSKHRRGRKVLYQRTALADALLRAGH